MISRMFLVVTLLLISISTSPSFAKNPDRQVLAEEMTKKMFNKNRTYWALKELDRFYFSTDNKMMHQINEPWGRIPLGTIMNTTWRILDDSLCWTYSAQDVAEFGISEKELCFDVYTKTPAARFMVGNHPHIRLKAKGQGVESPSIFRFFSWHLHDYTYDPAVVEDISEGMDTMAMYRKKYRGRIPNGTINRQKLSPDMQEFFDLAIGKIFHIRPDYMYFDPTGDYYWINQSRIEAADGDLDKMVETAGIGSWSIKDNIICWEVGIEASSCEYLFPKGTGLKNHTSNEILGTFHTGMTRFHFDAEEGIEHVTIEESDFPELFSRFKQISQDVRAKK